MGGRGSEGLLPPWLLIRRVLAIMESRLQMHGRRLWWRSVFYAPPGFAKESDSRHVECNLALISHMQLAGLGERRFDKERAQYLGNELNLVGGMPLERQCANWHGWNGRWGEAFFSTGGSSSNFWNHYLFNSRHSIETPWWCPQRNQWIGHRPLGGCDTCVLPPNFALCCTSARMTGGPNTTFSRRSSTSTSGKAHCASTTTIPRWLSSSTSPMITTSTIAAVGPQRGRHRSGGTPSDPCRKRWRGGTLCGPPLPGNLGMAPPAAAGLRCALLPPTSPPGPLLRRDTAVIIGSSGAQP